MNQITDKHIIDDRNKYSYEQHTKEDVGSFNFDAYNKETIQMSREIKYVDGVYEAVLISLLREMSFGGYEEAYKRLNEFEKGHDIDKMEIRCKMRYYNILCIYHCEHIGDYETGVHTSKKELELAEELKDSDEIMRIKMNIGTINFELGHYDTAIAFIAEAQEYYESVKDLSMLAYCHTNLGDLYVVKEAYEKARAEYKLSVEYAVLEHEPNPQLNSLVGMARIDKLYGNYVQSTDQLKEAIELAGISENIDNKLNAFLELIDVYTLMERYDEALHEIYYIENHVTRLENKRYALRVLKYKAEILKQLNQTEEAYESLKWYIEINNQLNEEKTRESMAALVQEQYDQSIRQLETIAAIGRELTTLSDLSEVLLKIKHQLSKVLAIDVISVGEIIDNELCFNHYIVANKKVDTRCVCLDSEHSLGAICVRKNKELIVNDLRVEYAHIVDKVEKVTVNGKNDLKVNSLMYAPLIAKGEVLGVFTIQSYEKNAYSSIETNIFRIILDYVAIAVVNVYQKNELERLSIKDNLTGLFNRRGFIESYERSLFNNDDQIDQVALMMLDLDYFKSINDTHGHLAGDEVLRQVSEVLLKKENNDIKSGRLGGEEFGVFIVNKTIDDVIAIAESLCDQIAQLKVNFEGQLIQVTTSIGVTVKMSGEDWAYDQLYVEADNSLYQAKADGRNRVEVYPIVNKS